MSAALVVFRQELRDLWLGGRGLALSLAYSVLLGVIAYLVATNAALNFLEQRESVNLTLQVAVTAGGLLALLAAADAISGERERGTLEGLLLTPVPRPALAAGKLLAALTVWVAAFAIAVPYLWFLGRGVGVAGRAAAAGLLAGTLLAVALASLGLLISLWSRSNRGSLSLALFLLLALLAPTQLPAGATRGWAGDLLLHVNPLTAGSEYLYRVVVRGHGVAQDPGWLASPALGAAVLAGLAVTAARGLRLRGGLAR